MKILVAIANFGTKNSGHLHRLMTEYRSMNHDVDIVVLSNIPKDLGPDVEVMVGLPTKNPWSLPFSHKKLFAERINDYDLFIYSEDDTLVTQRNIEAFLEVSKVLPENEIAGFMRYEVDAKGKKNCSTVHGHFHWIPNSVKKIGEYTFARFTNDHSACHVLTQDQLKKAIESGGFLVSPHEGKYDLLCTAATDPYTQCGFKKVICISRIDDFLLHHLPNQYIGKMGIELQDLKKQIEALFLIEKGVLSNSQLFETQKNLDTPIWNKNYYEACNDALVSMIPIGVKDILSVGCGWGNLEGYLVQKGFHVVAIPIDNVIAVGAKEKGVTILEPDFDEALKSLSNKRFDCIIFSNVFQHINDPDNLLSRFLKLLKENGMVITKIPNFNSLKTKYGILLGEKIINREIIIEKGQLNPIGKGEAKKWFQRTGLNNICVKFLFPPRLSEYSKIFIGKIGEILASEFILKAEKG